jgi:adenylate cyclase
VATVTAILHDQMTVRRTRLACGLVMFTYVALHLCMHALGNVSFAVMQGATLVHEAVWHNPVATVALYGAFAVHFSLALWALYARRSFRMGAGEITRLVLGFSIVPLMVHHFVSGRYVWSAFEIARGYDVVLTSYFVLTLFNGWRQIAVLLIAWTHGCLGIHFGLRQRPGYARFKPLLLAIAVLLPTLSLLGIYQGTRELVAHQKADPAYLQSIVSEGHMRDPVVRQRVDVVKDRLYWLYALLLAGVFVARGVRWAVERRRGLVSIGYPGGRVVRVPIGYPVLEASRSARIPHASICGGRGRCTTCRIRVLRGFEALPKPRHSEQAALARLRAGPNVRLACQLRPRTDIAVLPLLPPDITANDPRRNRESASTERFVAIMFIDIRRSTALFESRLPYDVVFLLNHFFDAVAAAVVKAGGAPNQFLGDGVMAIFGMRSTPEVACAQALAAAQLVRARLTDMNRLLANELPTPIEIGVGLHAGTVILGEIGYRDRFVLTAIGDTVHVAARLQDLTKDFGCELVVSEAVAATAGIDLAQFPEREVQVRGREAPLRVRLVRDMALVAA